MIIDLIDSYRHGLFMCHEMFVLSHYLYGMANTADAFFAKMLEGDLPAETVKVYTVVGGSIAVSGQGVIRTAGIVASTLTGILSDVRVHRHCREPLPPLYLSPTLI